MGKTLVLAEKPSVGRELARVLGCRQNAPGFISGGSYVVTWALGHLVTLADPETYGNQYKTWSLESLPMLPEKMQLVIIRETSKQFSVVQSLLKRADITDIVIATDSGREGELVARWILIKAGCKKPAKRLWISSQTDRAIREGFAKLRPSREYDNLYQSARARAEADWLVGLNITRALTCKYNAQLSAGRVQTPTLSLIVDREKEIKSFVPKEFYTVRAEFDGFSALWSDVKGHSRLSDRTRADAVINGLPRVALVTTLQKQPKFTSPPPAYDLTELQRDANRKYAYSAKQTLSLMQSLYERHKLLTYPRTDSRYISDDVVPTLPDRLRSIAIGPYQTLALALLKDKPLKTRYLVDNSKVTDHHAIIPTEEPVRLSSLSPEEKNIYDLVVRRFLAVLSAPFAYEDMRLTLTIGKERFSAKGKRILEPGWKAAYGNLLPADDEEADDLGEQALPALVQGQRLNVLKAHVKTGMTKPPARYTEATLLSAMEHPVLDKNMQQGAGQTPCGLGTPATRADIIEKLFSSFYMERAGKSLVPTSKAIQLMTLVPEELRSAELTARWEEKLMLISKGRLSGDLFVGDMRKYAAKLVSQTIASTAAFVHDNATREKCPDCGKNLLDVKGKKGRMLVCSDRACGYRKSLSVETNARCPNCHKKLELRGEGDKRLFVCVCGHRERLSDFEKRRVDSGANKRDAQNYLNAQKREGNFALAEQLARWKDQSGK